MLAPSSNTFIHEPSSVLTTQAKSSFGMGLKVSWGEELPTHLPATLHDAVTALTDVTATPTTEGLVLRWVGSKLDPPDDKVLLKQAWQQLLTQLPQLSTLTTDYQPYY
jgi:hypothetical protein